MSNKFVTPEDFAIAIQEIIEDTNDTVKEILRDTSLDSAEYTCQQVKANSMQFKSRRHPYANGWTVSAVRGGYVVHNKRHYRLTHLLEHGHAVSNQFGATGHRAGAHPHIAPAEAAGVRKFIDEVNQKLETEL